MKNYSNNKYNYEKHYYNQEYQKKEYQKKEKDMKKFAANSAFFKQQKAEGMTDVLGGGDAAESARDNGGSISEKGLAAAFKRAKTSGNFAV